MKYIESLNRTEVIQSLRSYIDPKDFHRMILESTATLKGALQYHVEPDKTKPNIPQGPGPCACGLHWAHVGKHAPAGSIPKMPRNFVFAYSIEPTYKQRRAERNRQIALMVLAFLMGICLGVIIGDNIHI
jgi:hypothetical protein